MKPNYTESEFDIATSTSLLSCFCYNCNAPFNVMKKNVVQELNNKRGRIKFCSKNCFDFYQTNQITILCTNCNTQFTKKPSKIKTNNFCSRSCAATYNNKHKTNGYRRSKLEKYLEIELIKLYPDLEILFNNKDIINSELDIYIPSLKLAFELNGIFHYEPIYGQNKLNQIQNNDNRKFQACIEHDIELCTIDVSYQRYFKENTSKKYLNILITIIDNKSMNVLNI
jgi:hypothetical protein